MTEISDSLYFDPEGKPISQQEWMRLFGARGAGADDWWRRRTDLPGQVCVSTVWLGIDHSFGEGPPEIWETMIFGGDHDQECWRYSSDESAFAGHARIVQALREGRDPRLSNK